MLETLLIGYSPGPSAFKDLELDDGTQRSKPGHNRDDLGATSVGTPETKASRSDKPC